MDKRRIMDLPKGNSTQDMAPKRSDSLLRETLPEDRSERNTERKNSKESNLNFGIETILQNEGRATEEKSYLNSGANCSLHDKTPSSVYANLCKLNSDFVTGWYGQVLSRFPRTMPNSVSGAYADLNWQLPDAQKDRFSMTRRIGHPYQNRSPPKRKKPRTSFTRVTVMELEKRFERQKYLASSERTTLARSLKISDSQVKTWFQNRRTKWRRQAAEEKELERQSANRLLLSMASFPPK